MNEKGFTLIELLATIAILGLIMTIAVPNVISVIDKNKKNTYVEDAKKMITLAEYKFRSDTRIEAPAAGQCIVIRLRALDLTELHDGPEGGSYDLDLSYVVIANVSGTYEYSVTIQENYDGSKKGLALISRELLNKETASKKIEGSALHIEAPVTGNNLNGSIVKYVYDS